ncbi:MAG: thioesterase [Niveispirillum sp.]|nr:thioesterase [Niveispirillum sp.]
MFRSWGASMPTFVELCPIQLPGRENRLSDPPFSAIDPLVDRLANEILPWLDKPYVLFGHSMGSLIAFELTRALRRKGAPLPTQLLLSAHRAPHLPIRRPRLIGLSDEAFLEAIKSFGGTPQDVFAIPDLVNMILPALRADFSVCDGYNFIPDEPLPCPFVLYAGRQDSEVSPQEVEAWGEHSSGGTKLRIFPGDHFFLRSDRDLLLRAMASVLA